VLSRPQFVSAVIVVLLAIVLWDQSRIRTLKRELESRKAPVPPPTIQSTTTPTTAPKVPPVNTSSGEESPQKLPEVGSPVSPVGDVAMEASLEKWLERVNRLKTWLDQKPELKTPELNLANNEDWLIATYKNDAKSEEDLQKAYNWVLNGAETRITSAIVKARNDYQDASGSQALEVQQILPYLDPELHEVVMGRYEKSKSLDGLNHRRRSTAK
jgi:hypothetical protein